MCRLPTPDCPTTVCRAPSGDENCPKCGGYAASDWGVGYFYDGYSIAGGGSTPWAQTPQGTPRGPIAAFAPNTTYKSQGSIKITLTWLRTDASSPSCVLLSVSSHCSAGVAAGYQDPPDFTADARNGFGDPTVCTTFTPTGGGCGSAGVHVVDLPVSKGKAEFLLPDLYAMVNPGSGSYYGGGCSVVVEATVIGR